IIFTLFISTQARFDKKIWHRIKRERELIFQLGSAGTVWQLSYTINLILLAILSNPAAVAVFSITRTLVRPITIMISTLMAVDFSRAVRAHKVSGKVGLKKVIANIWAASLLLTAIPMALLIIFPEFFLSLIYGEKYAQATLELQLRVMLFLPVIYGMPLDMGLAILRDTKFLVRVHLLSLFIGIAVLMGFYAFGQINATTALVSLVIARVAALPLMHMRYFKMIGVLPNIKKKHMVALPLNRGQKDA
ncbi:MAG: hypothetical protein L3J13_06725, partial [Devosiaceae bacterium]|nr:hypothetical protein [Devosiaceae bacterium]